MKIKQLPEFDRIFQAYYKINGNEKLSALAISQRLLKNRFIKYYKKKGIIARCHQENPEKNRDDVYNMF